MTPEEKAAADAAEAARLEAEKNKKVEFSEDQQTAIQRLIDGRIARVKTQHDTELKAERDRVAALEAELETAKAGKGGKKDGEETPEQKQMKDILLQEKSKTATATALAAKHEEEKKVLAAENLNIRKNIAIRDAAGNRFIDMEAVLSMVASKIEYDADTKEFVIRENGIVKQNSSLQNMSLAEYFEDFAKKRPYLVNSDVIGGAGSKENGGGQGSHLGVVRSRADLKGNGQYDFKKKSDYIKKFGLEAYEQLPAN